MSRNSILSFKTDAEFYRHEEAYGVSQRTDVHENINGRVIELNRLGNSCSIKLVIFNVTQCDGSGIQSFIEDYINSNPDLGIKLWPRGSWGFEGITLNEAVGPDDYRCHYEATVRLRDKYGLRAINADSSTTSEKIEVSRIVLAAYDQNGPININEEQYDFAIIGQTERGVGGAEILVPRFEFTETYLWPLSFIREKMSLWAWATGTINATTFRGMPPKSVLFLGVEVRSADYGDGECVFRFAFKQPSSSLEIGRGADRVIVPAKDGWDLLDIRTTERLVPGLRGRGNVVARAVDFVVLHSVYQTVNFHTLGLQPDA